MNHWLGLFAFLFVFNSLAQKENKEYSIPVLFDVKESTQKAEYGFSYDLNKHELVFENLGRINDRTFAFKFLQAAEIKKLPTLDGAGDDYLEVILPSGFFSEFEIQLINKSGKSLLKKSIDKAHIETLGNERVLGKTTRAVLSGIDPVVQKIMSEREPVKICVAQSDGKLFTRLCSRLFGIIAKNKTKEIKFDPSGDATMRALIENESAPLKNTVIAQEKMPMRAYFELQNGVVFEMMNQPSKIEFIEVTQDDTQYKFFGVGTLPFGAVKKERQSISFLSNLIPFDSTIGDFRDFYNFSVPSVNSTPVIVTPGDAGGLFQYFLTLSRVPREEDRVFFKNGTPNATYTEKFKVYGSSDKAIKFPNQADVAMVGNGNEFVWTPTLSKKGEFNKTGLSYEKEGIANRAYVEVYRGYSQEFSLRLTGISTARQVVTLGEVTYNKWFEDFGTRPGSLLYQRLGVGLNYFKSLNLIEIDDTGVKSSLEASSLSLKYRFTPGLWNWDESWGLILSYQGVKYETLNSPLAGGGFFWARSMPKFFDSIFNLVPLFRYPKWVDMDFVYYGASMDSKIKTNGTMALNFHGKILWTKSFYGEAGFGYKSFDMENADVGVAVRSLYLTLGLGLNF